MTSFAERYFKSNDEGELLVGKRKAGRTVTTIINLKSELGPQRYFPTTNFGEILISHSFLAVVVDLG